MANRSTARNGIFRYMAPDTEPSLYRNGKVLTRRDLDGSDSGSRGVILEERVMPVADARELAGTDSRTLESNGFEVTERPVTTTGLDFFDHDQVARHYYPECAEVIKEATGAGTVAAFDHNIRSAAGKSSKRRIEGGQQVQGPAHLVHGDYTLTSAPERLRQLAGPPGGNDTFARLLNGGETLLDPDQVEQAIDTGRFAIINLWRNIVAEPVVTDPLALCDASSFGPDDLVVFEIHYADRIGENYFAKHAEGQRWYFYPELTRDEALLIKQWDSAGALARSNGMRSDASDPQSPCTFSFHSAFADPMVSDDAADRWSMEVRCAVLYL